MNDYITYGVKYIIGLAIFTHILIGAIYYLIYVKRRCIDGILPNKTCEDDVNSNSLCSNSVNKPLSFDDFPTVTPEELKEKIKRDRDSGRPIRLYADGIYDLFHYGHARALEQAKKSFEHSYLLVGCCNDELTHSKKGHTVLDEDERYESLRHCKWVDEVVKDAPWSIDAEFLVKHNIDYVCHDAIPYAAGGCSDVYGEIKRIGKFYETQRTDGVSTSDLIVRIVKDYDTFVRRNLQRGISAEEMGVPYVTEKALYITDKLEKLEDGVKKTWKSVEELLEHWNRKSESIQRSFLSIFHKDGSLRRSIRNKTHEWKEHLFGFLDQDQ